MKRRKRRAVCRETMGRRRNEKKQEILTTYVKGRSVWQPRIKEKRRQTDRLSSVWMHNNNLVWDAGRLVKR